MRNSELSPEDRISIPKLKDILEWLHNIRNQFQTETVKNLFTGNGYLLDSGIDYGNSSESDNG